MKGAVQTAAGAICSSSKTRMQMIWSEHPSIDDANSLVFNVTVEGTKIVVHITEEAEEDKGLPVCKAMAERRIRDAITKGKLPKRLYVKATDFRLG
jgi:hypothetical protein